ncbi:MAG TPA: hypothetical protein VFG83_01985, partial [Kofleriaceae bacterium]|nr:hypothetical protein [Kofleriaceae bacterium]
MSAAPTAAVMGIAGNAAMAASARVCERWAPEATRGGRPSGAMSRMAFADATIGRFFSPSLALARRSQMGSFAGKMPVHRQRSVAHTSSWVFPFPWYADELAWLE